ncbi:MAG: complex I NDUFA9 subunit family protein [Pseudomonadota bacterium]
MAAGKNATVFGGSGFVGRYAVRRLVAAGWQVRVAVRSPGKAETSDQVTAVACDVRDDRSVAAAIEGADAVVNLVAILAEAGPQTFEALHVAAPERIAKAASAADVSRLVHVSSIGADPAGGSEYARTKGRGETLLTAAFPRAVILRPSLIFGPEDQLFNRFESMAKHGPAVPIFGGTTKFQPIYVDDVAQAIAHSLSERTDPGVYELGGPEIETFAQLMNRMLYHIKRRRIVLDMPFFLGATMGGAFDLAQKMSGGFFQNGLVTADQVASLKSDNVVASGARTLADLGVDATPMDDVLPGYLARYRPGAA